MSLRHFWVSAKFATASVTVNSKNVVTDTGNIFKAFVGQDFNRLLSWLEKRDNQKPLVEEI